MSKHTPWHIHQATATDGTYAVLRSDAGYIGHAKDEETALMFAAAPSMLEALKLYAIGDDCWVDGAPDADNSRHSETCGYCRATAAIAKAEGK